MENTNQQQDQYESFFSDGIDWASIPLPGARMDQSRLDGNLRNVVNENVVADVTLESMTKAGPVPRSRIDVMGRSDESRREMQPNNVDINIGEVSFDKPECTLQDAGGGNVSRSMMGLDGEAVQQSQSSSETILRKQLEELQKILAEKDAALFDLESTVVALEAETTSRIKKSEQDSANKVKAAEDELRRMQHELDSKNLALVKSRKRRIEEERQKLQDQKKRLQNDGNDAYEETSNSNTIPWQSPSEKRMQPQSVEVTDTPMSVNAMPTASSSFRHRTDTNLSQDISNTAAVSHLMPTNASTSITSDNVVLQETNISSFQTSHETEETKIEPNISITQKIAAHLLLHCDNPTHYKLASVDNLSLYSKKDSPLTDPLLERDECKEDKRRIRAMLESMAITSPLSMRPSPITTKGESISETVGATHKERVFPVFDMIHFTRELICMFVAKFPTHSLLETTFAVAVDNDGDGNVNGAVSHENLAMHNKGDTKEKSAIFHPRGGTVSWSSVEWILYILHQVCFQSIEARSIVRQWICQSCSNPDPEIIDITHKATGDTINNRSASSTKEENMSNGGDSLRPSFTSPSHVLSRIKGISSKLSKHRIMTAALNMKDVFATGKVGENSEQCDFSGMIWDPQHKEAICGKFFKILSSLIIGKNKHEWEENPYFQYEIPNLIQINSMALLHVWLNDYPHEIDNKKSIYPKNLWIICVEYLIIPWSFDNGCGLSNRTKNSTSFWTDLISAIEIQSKIPGIRPVGRRRYLRWINEKEDICEDRDDDNQKHKPDSNTLEIHPNQSMGADAFSRSIPQESSDTHPSLVDSCSDILTKCNVFQLLEILICSSSRVRHLLFDNVLYAENPNFRKGVTGVRRILASILDDLQGFIIPYLSKYSYLLRNDGFTTDEKILMEPILSLCTDETRLMAILCESVSGCDMMLTQMKMRSNDEGDSDTTAENGDSDAGVAVIVDVLECCVRVIIHISSSEETGKDELSHLWSSIVDNALSFIHLISSHTQENELNVHAMRKDKPNHTSFASIISGVNRKHALCSSCIMIVDSEVIAGYCCFEEGALRQARLILQDLVEVD